MDENGRSVSHTSAGSGFSSSRIASSKQRARPRPAGVKRLLTSFIVMVVVNVMAATGTYGFSKSNEELSRLNPTYLTPDGATFAVWGVIYILELLAVFEALCNAGSFYIPRREQALFSLATAFLLNAAWLFVFAREQYALSLGVMLFYLLSLARAYAFIDMRDTDVFLPAAISMNLAWVCVAACINTLFTAARLGPDDIPKGAMLQSPAGSQELAAGAAVGLVVLGVLMLVDRKDWCFAATLAWALLGVRRAQCGWLATAAGVCAGLSGLTALAGLLGRWFQPRR